MQRINNAIFTILFSLILISSVSGQKKATKKDQTNQLLQLARRYGQIAQYSRALQIYQRLWGDYPENINYYRGVKNNLIKLNRFKQAEIVVNQMLRVNSSAIIEADLGDVYYKMGEKEKAFLVWRRIINKNPNNQSVYYVVASSMSANRLHDEAIEIYRNGRKSLNNKKLFLIEMANLYRSRLDYKNATLLYLDYLDHNPKQYSYVEQNITSFASDEELTQEIEKILLGKIKKNKDKIQLRNILAALYIRSSNYRAALEEYSIIDQYIVTRSKQEKSKVGRELFRFAQNAFNDGAYEYAIQAYQLVLSRYPKSSFAPNSKYGIANAYEKLGDYSKAIEKYNETITSFKQTPLAKKSYFRIGEIQLEQFSDPLAAEESYKKVMGFRPLNAENLEAILRIGDCYVMRGLLDQAKQWYDQSLQQKPSIHYLKMKALLKIGKVHYWTGEFEAAGKKFAQIQSDPINITNEQAGIYVNDALEYLLLIEENKNSPQQLKPYAKAELFYQQRKYEDALSQYREITKDDKAKSLADDAWLKIGQLSYLQNKFEQSIEAYQQIITNYPNSVHSDLAQKLIGDVYERGIKDSASALKAYELVLTNYPDSIYLEEVRKKIREIEKMVL